MLAVANVSLRRFLRERSNLFFVFALPLAIILMVGSASGSRESAPFAVVGAETEVGTAVLAQLPADRVEAFETVAEAERAVGDTKAAAVVVFPVEATEPVVFSAMPNSGLDVRADLDAAVAVENQRLALLRQAALAGASEADIVAAQGVVDDINVVVETSGTITWGGLDNLDASALTQVVLFMFLSALTASTDQVRDRSLGTARRKAAAPISVTKLVLGETLGRFWITMFQAGLIVTITALIFDVGWGDPLATGAILVTFGLMSTGAGILLGSAFDNPEGASGAGIMIALVLAALGGAMAPVEIFPDVMQTVARFTPHFWAVDGLQTSLTGGGISDIVRPLAVLAAIAGGVLAVSTAFYRRRTFGAR